MSDLSFNVIALDRASKTFLSAAESIDRMTAKLERLDGKTATATVNIKTDESTKALDSFTNRFTLMTAGIAAASPVAGAAILGGIGASFIGVAALAQKSNQQVQDTYKTMWSNVVNSTKNATDSLVPQLVGAGRAIDVEFQHLAPQMQQAFSAAGPDLAALTRGVTAFADGAMPGATSAMTNSLPVFQGVAGAAGQLGNAVGASFTSIGQHANEYGVVINSVGSITSSALGVVTTIVNNVASAWSDNANEINAAVGGIANVLTGLANGVAPVFSAALGAAAAVLHDVALVVEPLSPMLGTLGGVALATWGAFKLAGAVTVGVNALASGVLTLGGNMEAGAAKSATFIAAQQGVAVESSAAAVAVRTAGASAATASVGFAAAAETMAGPLGIALAVGTLAVGAFAMAEDDTKASTQDLQRTIDSLTSAFQSSSGAVNKAVVDSLQASQEYKDAAEWTGKFKTSQDALTGAVLGGGQAFNDLRQKLVAARDAAVKETDADKRLKDSLSATVALEKLDALAQKYQASRDLALQLNQAQLSVARTLVSSTSYQAAAADSAGALGVSLNTVSAAYLNVMTSGQAASDSIQDVTAAFYKDQAATAAAGFAIEDHLQQTSRAVAQAQKSVADASHSAANASRSIADAHHSEEQAARSLVQSEQGVADAQRGITQAQLAYTRAQDQARQAEQALSEARQQAVRDLKALHQQLDDAFTSEASARVRLFDAQQAAAKLQVDGSNARGIASGPVTADNEERVKAAIDLISAQNSLNAALQNGANVRADVTKADAAGVEGSKGVVSAQQGVVSAHRAVEDASYGLEQAKRGLQRAQQAVSDAAYQEQKAHQAVRDAQYQAAQAAYQLRQATISLKDAQDANTVSFDLNSRAGLQNYNLLQQLNNAIKTEFGPTAAGYNALIQTTADKFGITTGAAEALLKKLGDIPQDFKFGMTAVASANFDELNRFYDDKFGGHIGPIAPNVAHAFAAGGSVPGNGGPTADDQLAWVSSREWIHPVDSVDYYGEDFMRAIQKKQFPRFARGGQVDAARINLLFSGAGVGYQTSVNTLEVMGFPHPPSLPKYVPPVVDMSFVSSGSGVRGDRAANRTIVMSTFANMFGWSSAAEQAATDYLMMRESGYNNVAQNPTSTAYGMFQFLNSTWGGYGIPKTSDPGLQAIAGGRYIKARYGDPIGAAAHERAFNWYAHGGQVGKANLPRPRAYDNGGALPAGLSTVWNGTGKPENVRTSGQEDQLVAAIRELRDDLKTAVYESRRAEIRGTVHLADGALLGQIEAGFRTLETMSGVL